MDNIEQILKLIIHDRDWEEPFKGWEAIKIWPLAVGENIANHSRAARFNAGVLIVEVDNPIWSYHLSLLKQELQKKLNYLLQGKIIIDIVFKLGTVEKETEINPASDEHEDFVSIPEPDNTEIHLNRILDDDCTPEIRKALSVFLDRRRVLRAQKSVCPCCGEPYSNKLGELCPYCDFLVKRYGQEILLFIQSFPDKEFNDFLSKKPALEEENLFLYIKDKGI